MPKTLWHNAILAHPSRLQQTGDSMALNIVNVGYDSTNYYLLVGGAKTLLIDVGFPGTLPKLAANLKRKGMQVRDVDYLLATHYHPDHAGMAQELVNSGARLIVLDVQASSVPLLRSYTKPDQGYVEIDLRAATHLALAESRVWLRTLGIGGEIIATPGHSNDSVSLVLDGGAAFTGDLTPPLWGADEAPADDPVAHSWQALRDRNVHTIYPGHGPIRPLR